MLGRRFGWLWAAYAVSAFGSRLAFNAFGLVAIGVLGAGPTQVALLAAAGAAVGAAVAVPLGPWVEFRRKRPVMLAMDLVRCVVLLSIPAAYALGVLGFAQLLVAAVVVAAADITFGAASGAYLKTLVEPADLLAANSRLEATAWTTTLLGPPLGGVLLGVLGPVATVVADAVSYLLSAVGIRAIGGTEKHPARGDPTPPPARRTAAEPAPRRGSRRSRTAERAEGWRHILGDPVLRPLLLNTVLVNGLIMATEPLLAVLLLGPLGFSPWEYGIAFALPCLGGLLGSRAARPLAARFGRDRVMRVSGVLRACWPVGLVFVGPGSAGLLLVMGVEFGLIFCVGVFNPLFATCRLERTPADRTARTLAAWSVTGKAGTATLTALWGLLAAATGPRTAIAAAGALLLATPLLLPRRTPAPLPA
ncbi:MFS transporter [Streptomyces sp. NPDC058740]|uniref:MFS transporter n=1 Tax=Streptomyces sp. NPDC058740 TaxID=3346619 RepID=UPI0036C72E70